METLKKKTNYQESAALTEKMNLFLVCLPSFYPKEIPVSEVAFIGGLLGFAVLLIVPDCVDDGDIDENTVLQ